MGITKSRFYVVIGGFATQYQARLNKFKEELAENPHYALKWSKDAFEAASIIKVYGEVLFHLQKPECTLKALRETVLSRIMNGVKYPEFSSSPTANLSSAYDGVAWGKLWEKLDAIDSEEFDPE